MKGIRKILLSVLALNFMVAQVAFADEVNEALVQCRLNKGILVKGPITLENEGTKNCQEVLCHKSSANVGVMDFNDLKASIGKTEGDRGFANVVWDRKVCVDVQDTTSRVDAEVARIEAQREADRLRRAEEADREQASQNTGDGSGRRVNVNINGGLEGGIYGPWSEGDRVRINGKVYVVGSDRFYKYCVNKRGRDKGTIKKRCLRRSDGNGGRGVLVIYDDDGSRDGVFRNERRSPSYRNADSYYVIRNERTGQRLDCSFSRDIERCLREEYNIINARVGDWKHCSDCSVRSGGGTSLVIESNRNSGNSWGGILSGVAELAGAIAPPVFGYLGVKAQANAFENSQTAWANAQATGYEQCALLQQNYVESTYQYIQSNELPDREVGLPGCNGFNLGGFAGGGGQYGNGFGGFGNPFYSGGYSPGFVAGMNGPGVGFNLGLNANSGLFNPYSGLGNGGFGFGIGGGFGNGGFGNGGFGNGGFNTGFNTGASVQCFRAPCPGQFGGFGNGGFGNNGGFTGLGGRVNIGLNGGFGGNPYGGFGSGYGNPGYNGGFGGGFGSIGTGTVPWGQNTGGYWGNNGGFTGQGGFNNGGFNNGGSINGNQFFNVQAAHRQNYAAQGAGNFYQQAALHNQQQGASFNSANYGGGSYGGYGGYNPGFSPGNIGFNINGGFGFGF